jgi:hypothetical protein
MAVGALLGVVLGAAVGARLVFFTFFPLTTRFRSCTSLPLKMLLPSTPNSKSSGDAAITSFRMFITVHSTASGSP